MKISSSVKKATIDGLRAALASAVVGVCGGACGGAPKAAAPPPAPAASPSSPPIDFSFDSLDARPVTAEATRGEPTLVTFVTTSSIPAQAQVDFLVAMAKHDADRVHYAVVALEPQENRELVELYAKALSIPFPVALADAPTLAGNGPFGEVRGVPATVLLDRDGRIVWRAEGRVAKSAELRAVMRGL